MTDNLPPVRHWEDEFDRAWKAKELAEHPEVTPEMADEAIDIAHRMELAGVL